MSIKLRAAAVCIAIIAAAGLMIATFRTGWASDGSTVKSAVQYPVEFSAGTAEYDVLTTRIGAIEATSLAGEAIVAAALHGGFSEGDAHAIRRVAAERLGFLLAPDFETWVRLAGPCKPAWADESHPEHEAYMRRWIRSSSIFEQSPIASDRILVRRTEAGAQPLIDVRGTRFLRSGGRGTVCAAYPGPPRDDPTAEAIEILVPMQYDVLESDTVLKVMVVLRFYRFGQDTTWLPDDLFMYFDQTGIGVPLNSPAY